MVEPRDLSPLVAICMAVYRPKPDLFKRQIDSIKAQTHQNWVLVISDETEEGNIGAIDLLDKEVLARSIIHRSKVRLGFSLNFEKSMTICPVYAPYIAFCDQDDYWYSNKLEMLLQNIGSCGAIFSDFCAVDALGRTISNTQWKNRDICYEHAADLILFNAVAGASLMVKRSVLDLSLPFPRFKNILYDHWIALIALTTEGLTHCEMPLYDYVQHGSNAVGFNFITDKRRHKRHVEKLLKDVRLAKKAIKSDNLFNAFEKISEAYWYTSATASALLTRLSEVEKNHLIDDKQKNSIRKVYSLCFGEPFDSNNFKRKIADIGLSESSNVHAKAILFYRKFLSLNKK